MSFQLPPLPFKPEQVKSLFSEETIALHYGKHHRKYIDKTNSLLPGSGFEHRPIQEILYYASGPLFSHAAQAWNHCFFWDGLAVDSEIEVRVGLEGCADLRSRLEENFHTLESFKEELLRSATTVFGSGWTWLVKTSLDRLEIRNTQNGDVPFREENCTPLLVIDMWEHAYYVDYRNEKERYLKRFWKQINWNFVEKNLDLEDISDLHYLETHSGRFIDLMIGA